MIDLPREQTRKQEQRDRRERIAAIILAGARIPQLIDQQSFVKVCAADSVRWALAVADELIRQIDQS